MIILQRPAIPEAAVLPQKLEASYESDVQAPESTNATCRVSDRVGVGFDEVDVEVLVALYSRQER